MASNLVPVVLATYTRLNHIREVILALLNNEMAKDTTVFVFSDGPRVGDEAKVRAIREFLSTVHGFGEYYVVARERNVGMVANCIGGLEQVLDEHGWAIYMEDDIVTAPGFLSYMNHAMVKYQENKNIFSVSAFCPPICIPKDYAQDAFFVRRFNAWGVGIWKDRHDSVRQITREEFDRIYSDRKLTISFVDGGGRDMLQMLDMVAYGKLDAYDVRCMYTQYLSDQYTVYPTESLVKNIGLDGTGVHCGATSKFDVNLSKKIDFRLPEELIIDERIVKENNRFRSLSLLARLKYRLKKMVAK